MNRTYCWCCGIVFLALTAILATSNPAAAAVVRRSNGFNVLEHLATKTPYSPLQGFEDHTAPPAGCSVRHLNLVARHGTRNPSDDDIIAFDRLEEQVHLYHNNISSEYDWMRTWENPFLLRYEGHLSQRGKEENYEMAKRFMNAYPALFEGPYDSLKTFIRSTQEQRAMLSAESFGFGLAEGKGTLGSSNYEPVYVVADTESEDDILKFYDNCPRYLEEVADNITANLESKLYLETFIRSVADRFTTIITEDQSWKVTPREALSMWSICQAEGNTQLINDTWCSLFTEKEVHEFEYWEDLDDYYSKSYPYKINYEMVAPLLQDIYEAMLEVSFGESMQSSNFRFAHSTTVVPLITALGLYKDDFTLRHDSKQEEIDRRRFRTSEMSRKGTNIAFVLYECQSVNNNVVKGVWEENRTWKLKVLLNEKETIVDGCNGELYCSLKDFSNHYLPYLTTDLDEICNINAVTNK